MLRAIWIRAGQFACKPRACRGAQYKGVIRTGFKPTPLAEGSHHVGRRFHPAGAGIAVLHHGPAAVAALHQSRLGIGQLAQHTARLADDLVLRDRAHAATPAARRTRVSSHSTVRSKAASSRASSMRRQAWATVLWSRLKPRPVSRRLRRSATRARYIPTSRALEAFSFCSSK